MASTAEIAKANTKRAKQEAFARRGAAACAKLLGGEVVRVGFPGGRSRDSLRIHFADRSVIATRRDHNARATLEVAVLRELGNAGAPVPKILATGHGWVIQEDLGDQRLSQVLDAATPKDVEVWLDRGLESLMQVQKAGREAGLAEHVVVLGSKPEWRRRLVETPGRIGEQLELPVPELRVDDLAQALHVEHPAFIKWDARPGNAAAMADGRVGWFDWEHCGCRHPLDDVAWFLCDEFIGDAPEAEARLLERWLPHFADDKTLADAHRYLMTFGVFHMSVRLALILSHKGEDDWWDHAKCLEGDKIGVTAAAAQTICRRAARWAAKVPDTQPLAGWFEDTGELIAGM
ncbi:MAG: phosphotransferase [Rhodospirillaceae bacterium]|nr:phosphotransferase [Rhodospirillaceae bacterium]